VTWTASRLCRGPETASPTWQPTVHLLGGRWIASCPTDGCQYLDGLVFTAPMSGPLRERKFLHGQLKPAARRAACPDLAGP
jgi:hypothetical protein